MYVPVDSIDLHKIMMRAGGGGGGGLPKRSDWVSLQLGP